MHNLISLSYFFAQIESSFLGVFSNFSFDFEAIFTTMTKDLANIVIYEQETVRSLLFDNN